MYDVNDVTGTCRTRLVALSFCAFDGHGWFDTLTFSKDIGQVFFLLYISGVEKSPHVLTLFKPVGVVSLWCF